VTFVHALNVSTTQRRVAFTSDNGVSTRQNHASLLRRAPNSCTWHFPDVIKFRVAVHTLWEKAIRLWDPDYDPDRAQKLISSSMFRHLSTRKMSSKSMHAFLSNLANRQTDRQTSRAIALTSSVVGGKQEVWPPGSAITVCPRLGAIT